MAHSSLEFAPPLHASVQRGQQSQAHISAIAPAFLTPYDGRIVTCQPSLFSTLLRLTIALALVPPLVSFAQTTPAVPHAACTVNHADPTEAEVALYRHDWAKALPLFTTAYTKDPKDSRSHQLAIAALIGEGELGKASQNLDQWAKEAPGDPYAVLAAGELRHAEGDWLEAYALARKALQMDLCLPVAYADLAGYEELAGYRATARRHYALAHQMAPNDQAIRIEWIESLASDRRIEELKKYIENSNAVDNTRRASLATRYERLSSLEQARCQLASFTGTATIPMVPIYGPAGIADYGLEIAFNGHKRRSTPAPAASPSPAPPAPLSVYTKASGPGSADSAMKAPTASIWRAPIRSPSAV